jgi:hypothetical protein
MWPCVPASGRPSLTCLSLVMKGSPVRVRASASYDKREILFAATRENVVYVRFRDGDRRRVRLGDEATADKVFATAYEQTCPDFKIIVAIE